MKLVAAFTSPMILVGAMASGQETTLTYMMWDPDQLEIEGETICRHWRRRAACRTSSPGPRAS